MRKLAIVVALSSTMLATPAFARNGAWYVGGDFGAMIVEDVHFDFGLTPTVPSAAGAQYNLNHDYGIDGALYAGYDLGAFRLEAEVSYKRARLDDVETAVTLPGQATVGAGGVTWTAETCSRTIARAAARLTTSRAGRNRSAVSAVGAL